ncbi:hypothetical protein F4818DRAFT_444497 [Hypoxylon cercidicola]|nr:hypothetical protein F4818DRAFT_444497 [Hypoxylon cercidicola]
MEMPPIRIFSREFECPERTKTGRKCGKTFTRLWNLKRHLKLQHQTSQVQVGSGFANLFTELPPRDRDQSTGDEDRLGHGKSAMLQLPGIAQLLQPPQLQEPARLAAEPIVLAGGAATGPAGTAPREIVPQNWSARLQFKDHMPIYNIKLSKKNPPQPKAIDWLTAAGKEAFDGYIERVMASWGVKPCHSGICIMWPQDWVGLGPAGVVAALTFESCPLVDSDRSTYKYSDHITVTARAAAWFGSWPRSGIEFDNFMECGPFERMDASHRCHTPLCVNPHHITFESAAYNLGRRVCQEGARFLRNQGRDVPVGCDKHDPPCLMQHAALTIYERCVIQASIYRQARGMAQISQVPRPRWHRYPTFEQQLPLKYVRLGETQAIVLRPGDLIRQTAAEAETATRRPALVCRFCPRIKSFAGVVALWGHIVQKHDSEGSEAKVREVRRAAGLWREYMQAIGKAGASYRRDPTFIKVLEATSDGFTWEQVKMWRLM